MLILLLGLFVGFFIGIFTISILTVGVRNDLEYTISVLKCDLEELTKKEKDA